MLLWSRNAFKLDSVQLNNGQLTDLWKRSPFSLRVKDPALHASVVVIYLLARLLEGVNDIGLPIVLDQAFKIFSISW